MLIFLSVPFPGGSTSAPGQTYTRPGYEEIPLNDEGWTLPQAHPLITFSFKPCRFFSSVLTKEAASDHSEAASFVIP